MKKSLTKDFIPKFSVEKGNFLKVIYSVKLVITTDLCWNSHVDYTVKEVKKVLWQLTRLKEIGAQRQKLIEFYVLKIRSILIFGSVCFHSSLTKENFKTLELQQKRSLACNPGTDCRNYSHALGIYSLPRLDSL